MDSQTRGAHWVQKCSRADQRVALLRKKKGQLNKHCMQTETLQGLLFPAQYPGQVQEQTVGEYTALPLGNPHVLWGWQMPFVDIPTFQTWEGLWGM